MVRIGKKGSRKEAGQQDGQNGASVEMKDWRIPETHCGRPPFLPSKSKFPNIQLSFIYKQPSTWSGLAVVGQLWSWHVEIIIREESGCKKHSDGSCLLTLL